MKSVKSPNIEEIRKRAYELYLEHREESGREVEDWLEAERELRGESESEESDERETVRPGLRSRKSREDEKALGFGPRKEFEKGF